MSTTSLNTKDYRWSLNALYNGSDDPVLDTDIAKLTQMIKNFSLAYKRLLTTKLGEALHDYAEIEMLSNKIFGYLALTISTNLNDEQTKNKIAATEKIINVAVGEYLTFFEHELVKIPQDVLETLIRGDAVIARHRPWLEKIRLFTSHLLDERVESALTKRASFGPSAWAEFFDEVESDLRFDFETKNLTLTEMLDIVSNHQGANIRASALKIINDGLKEGLAKYSAQTLSLIVGAKSVEDKERGYSHPMAMRNKSSQIPDAIVETLHQAVQEVGGPLAKRYYRLKAAHLGMKTLKWSDRNAKMPFADTTVIPFNDALETVILAYAHFSPTLADRIRMMVQTHLIDAPAIQGKRSGAFNYSFVLPENKPIAFTFLNYLGSNRDVMTLAHEVGHGVHGLLAGETQGTLMAQAPIPYAETASVFGEMTTFNYLKKQLLEKNETESLLALLMSKIDDMINTVVRQIAFSNFERQIHNAAKRFSADELSAIWKETTIALYGNDGDVFTYENFDNLWSYISHFHRPFYVYGYAFGELLTQSLYAQQPTFGEKFEPLYLDLLRAGGTKDVTQLLKPFGLDPSHPAFWTNGLEKSLGTMIQEAEDLSRNRGVVVEK